jgi:hypothetical protein
MICGILDDMKSTIAIFLILVFLSIIIYYFHERIQYLEHSVSRQNQVLSDFISNVQREVVHLGDSDIKIIKSDEMDKIVISDDDDDSDSDSESEDDSDSDSESESESEHEHHDDDGRNNIKVIELIDNKDEDEEESHLQEMNNDDLHISPATSHASASHASHDNVKKIDLLQKEDKSQEEDGGEDNMDVVGSKKLSVGELRALIVSKGLANQNSANKMKKLELIEALNKL